MLYYNLTLFTYIMFLKYIRIAVSNQNPLCLNVLWCSSVTPGDTYLDCLKQVTVQNILTYELLDCCFSMGNASRRGVESSNILEPIWSLEHHAIYIPHGHTHRSFYPPHPCQHLSSFSFLMFAQLTNVMLHTVYFFMSLITINIFQSVNFQNKNIILFSSQFAKRVNQKQIQNFKR